MTAGPQSILSHSPIAVGGIGGSGTRVVAQAFQSLGFYIGSDLNEERDNLWFTLLFKRVEVLGLTNGEFENLARLFINAMCPCRPWTASERKCIQDLAREMEVPLLPSASWRRERAASLLAQVAADRSSAPRWGWKEPNTHLIIDRWLRFLPTLKYVHVIRNGLDMAFSDNQQQPSLWGGRILGETGTEVCPRNSLRFWCATQRRIDELKQSQPDRILLLDFERLCSNPAEVVQSLVEFIGVEPNDEFLENFPRRVAMPASVGRFKRHGLEDFAPEDVEYVASLGFDTLL